jgi:hypothetical protein
LRFRPDFHNGTENPWPKPTGIGSSVTGCGCFFDAMKVGLEYSWRSVPQIPTKAEALQIISRALLRDLGGALHFDLVVSAFRFFDLINSEVSRSVIS